MCLKMYAPIYDQIVQIENIELHKLYKIIQSKDGQILDLCTAKIICNFLDIETQF